MDLEIVTVGNELLLGHTVDTNAVFLGQHLASVGVRVVRRTTVGDDPSSIRDAVRDALSRTGLVVTTGGLGPTKDDMTKQCVADVFGLGLTVDAPYLAELEQRFASWKRGPMPAANRTQAEVPDGAIMLPNSRGTAPGLWIEGGSGTVVMLPGVPDELERMVLDQVLPRVARLTGETRVTQSHVLRAAAISESALAGLLDGVEDVIAPLTLAYLPTLDGVDLRLTAWSIEPAEASHRLQDATARLKTLAGRYVYGEGETTLAEALIDRLRHSGHSLSVAESCTGGAVTDRITAIPGISDIFRGTVVAYANEAKEQMLGVEHASIVSDGAVSERVVREMVAGAAERFGTSCAIGVTGVAGPSGGSAEKPVGTVWIAAKCDNRVVAHVRRFPGHREAVRRRASQSALFMLHEMVGEDVRQPGEGLTL